MTNPHGSWIWYELMTTDAEGARAFYESVVGWTIAEGHGDPPYAMIDAGDGMVGGMLTLSPDMTQHGAKPAWLGYVGVDDVDKMVKAIVDHGGRETMPARDIDHIGRIAMVTDPQGAPFYVMKPTPPADNPDATSTTFSADPSVMRHCSWNELWTSDPKGALHFYGTHFGWVEDHEMDMGPSGKYHVIRHGVVTGGIAGMMPGQSPGWTFYFRVPSIATAVDKIKAGGGTVEMGPHEIPGGDHIIIGTDPQSAKFALVGGK